LRSPLGPTATSGSRSPCPAPPGWGASLRRALLTNPRRARPGVERLPGSRSSAAGPASAPAAA
jgi:hypothetical protein